jgi:hypothetical protein
MGNRASYSIDGFKGGNLYLHWQGGRGSTEAFINETLRRIGGAIEVSNSQKDIQQRALKFAMVFHQVIKDFHTFKPEVIKPEGISWLDITADNIGDYIKSWTYNAPYGDNVHYFTSDVRLTVDNGHAEICPFTGSIKGCISESAEYTEESRAVVYGYLTAYRLIMEAGGKVSTSNDVLL